MINRSMARAAIARLVPGGEGITLYSRSGSDESPAYTAYAVGNCRFAAHSYQEGGGPVAASSLPTAQLKIQRRSLEASSAPDPKPGDIARRDADSTYWSVLGVHMSLFREAVSCDVQEHKGTPP